MIKPSGLLALIFCMVVIVGCATPPAIPSSATSTASVVPAQSSNDTPIATATVTPVLDVSTLCPAETESSASYISTENGVCFLYPAGFEAEPDVYVRPDEAVILRGPSLTAGMDRLWVTLNVDYNGPADGMDSALC